MDADDLSAAKAILTGIRDRYQSTGTVGTLIHTVSNRPDIVVVEASLKLNIFLIMPVRHW